MREPRLGDDIDDFCVRCKRIMNHSVVSVINGEPAKVRCRTCHSDHDFRHEQPPPPKVDLRKQALFNDVLKKVNPEEAAAVVAAEPPEAEIEAPEADVEAPEAEAEAAVAGDPLPPPKPKAKGKTRK
ncbi:MAG TPA: hypothetical protein VLW65_08590 [Bryobacteraceae bacterium]|nr:hypothetical protein [Bryobacteraceae bacterium]